MTGNEVGDRVHNFFAQDNLSHGQRNPKIVDGSWPVVGNNLWAGNHRHNSLPSSNSKNYNLQQADTERGHTNYSFTGSHGMNPTQSTQRPEFTKSQSQSQQTNLNGYMEMDTEFECNNISSRGLSMYSSHGYGTENYTTAIRSESSESPVSFDFFGSEQQTSGKQTGMLQSFPQQQPGFNKMQLMQQQVILRKMHEFQRQQQIQQLEARQHNSSNQIPFISKQASDNHSPAVINVTHISPISEASNYSCAIEPTAGNTNWLQRGTPIQGSSNGFRFTLEQGQALNLIGLVPQQVDQSLYGVPISNTRGASHEYSQIALAKSTMQELALYNNTIPGNQFSGFTDEVSMQDRSLVSRQGFQGGNMFGHGSGQGLNVGMNVENLHQGNSPQTNARLQKLREKQELAAPSESLQEKTVMQVSSSQNVVALDPTEEKILFGDDNIWNVFESNANIEARDFNTLSGTGSLNGFLSLQSGTWSALMQSAVAETSSNAVGLQEEWSGLSFQNAEVRVGSHQSLTYENHPRHERSLAENNFDIASALSSGSVHLSNDANSNYGHQGVSGFHQPVQKFLYDCGERLQMDSTHRSIHQSAEEGSKWLSRGPLQKLPTERNQIYGTAAHSLDAQLNAESTSGNRPPEQSVSFYNSGQTFNKLDVCGVGESDVSLKNHDIENKLPHYLEEISHGGLMRKIDSGPISVFGLEHVKSDMGGPQVNREDYKLNSIAVIPNPTAGRAYQDNRRLLPNSHQLNYHADSSMRSENSGHPQYNLNKAPQVLELSIKTSDNDAAKMHESENYGRKENSSDSRHSNLPQHTTTGGLPVGKQKLSGRKAPGPRKFQYHPMGNLDEDLEPSYATKHATHSQVVPQQISRASYNHNHGYFGQSNFFGQFPKTSTEVEKGHSSDLEGNKKGNDEAPSRGTLPAFSHNTSAPLDRSGGLSAPNKVVQSSQYMLELLHKVDHAEEHANSDVGHLQQNQFSTSQGFNLQLAPPSQWLPVQNRVLAPRGSNQTDHSFSPNLTSPERGDTGHMRLPSSSQVHSLPSSLETSQQESKTNKIGIQGQNGSEASQYSTRGNLSLTSGFPHSSSQLQNQQMMGSSGLLATNQPCNRDASQFQRTADATARTLICQSARASLPDTSGITSNDTAHSHEGVPAPQILMGEALPSSQPFIVSGISQQRGFPKMVPNAWTKVSDQHHSFGFQPHKVPQTTLPSSQSNSNVVSTSLTQQDQEGNRPSGDSGLAEKMIACQRIESAAKNWPEASPSISASTLRDIEAFGRSLKPNNLLHENYALLHQMQAMKGTDIDPSSGAMNSTENDPSNKELEKLEGADSGLGAQIAPETEQSGELNVMVGDSSVHHSEVPSGDSRMLSFSGPVDSRERNASQLGNIPSQGVLASGRKDSDSYSHVNIPTSLRVDHSKISPQMAPSWFNQFGTFKNGQMSMFDIRKNATVKAVEQPYILAKATDGLAHKSLEQLNDVADSNQVDHVWQRSTPTSVAMDHISPPRSVALGVADPCLLTVRPKKRKGGTSELIPWREEVAQGSRSLLSTSMTEVEWAKSANRLIDQVDDEAEMIEDGPPKLRHKRRLIFTTQLMQQLFCPPPLGVLSADASSSYETVAYLVARLTLGNACSVIPCSRSNSFVSLDSANLFPDDCKISERSDDQHLSEFMIDSINRARNLERDFIRMGKGLSVVDLRIECQDLEKTCVIHRFAKFHGRGQADESEASSSSDVGAAICQRPFPQRYITAVPLPRNLPDRVQCLSL